MKDYQKKFNISPAAKTPIAILPDLETIKDPTPGTTSALVYNHTGAYIGWCTPEAMKKYLYGKLYYKTKGAYSIQTAKTNRWAENTAKTTSIKEKATGGIALVIVVKEINEKDLVDATNTKEKALYTLKHEIAPFTISDYNYYSLPDKFGFLKDIQARGKQEVAELVKKHEKEKQAAYNALKQKAIDHLKSVIEGEDALKAGSEEAGINIDF